MATLNRDNCPHSTDETTEPQAVEQASELQILTSSLAYLPLYDFSHLPLIKIYFIIATLPSARRK